MNFIGILTWLMSSFGSRVLLSLGMGFISFAAISEVANTLIGYFSSTWGGIPSAVLSLLSLGGFTTSLGWIIGAYLAKLSLSSISKLGRIPSGEVNNNNG